MIKNNESISMAESLEYIQGKREMETELKGFIRKFVKMKPEKAKEIRKKLESLDILKMKDSHISKIIDIMPEDKENLNKIFTDVGLTDDESKQILDVLEEFK